MNDEFKMIEVTLDANLKILRMLDESKVENKKEIIVGIALELRTLCDSLITPTCFTKSTRPYKRNFFFLNIR